LKADDRPSGELVNLDRHVREDEDVGVHPPEMQAWTAPQLGGFLSWADTHDPDLAMGWRLLAATGMRRGEALALRWRDVDLDAGRPAVRRSVGVVKSKGPGELGRGPDEDRPIPDGRPGRRHGSRPGSQGARGGAAAG